MTETWLPVVGYEGLYEVSDLGRVRRSGPGRGAVAGKLLSPRATRKGYVRVALCGRDHAIHRLVLTAFRGTPAPNTEGNHLDGDKRNNALANLEWATPVENARHAVATGLRKPLRGAANGRNKLTEQQRAEIRAMRGKERQRDTAARYGISDVRVSQIQRQEANAA